MHLLRCLFLEAHFQFEVVAAYLPGIHNSLADDLSRNRLLSFRSKVPSADPLPAPMPLPSTRSSAGHQQRLDISSLDPIVLQYCEKALANSTQKLTELQSSVSRHFASHSMYQHRFQLPNLYCVIL